MKSITLENLYQGNDAYDADIQYTVRKGYIVHTTL